MAAWTPGLYPKHSTSEGFIISQYNFLAIYCQPKINKLFIFGCGRFHVELHFSPGVNCCVQKNLPPGPGFRPHSRNDQSKQHLSRIDQEDSTPDDTPVQSVSPVEGPSNWWTLEFGLVKNIDHVVSKTNTGLLALRQMKNFCGLGT